MEMREIARKVIVPTALTLSLGMAACSNETEPDESSNTTVVAESLTGSEQELANRVCPEGFTMSTPISEELALSEVGSPESMFASFTVVDDEGNEALQSTEVAGSDILEQACKKASVLGTLDALFLQTAGYNESGRFSLPDDTLISVIERRTDFYRANPGEAVKSLNELASIINIEGGIDVTDSFNAVQGQATLIAPERTEDGTATQVSTKEVPTEGLFTGYQVNYDLDDSNLTEAQKATLEQISESLVILPNGAILSNQNLGRSTTNFEIVEDAPVEVEAEIVETPDAPEAPVTTIITEDGREIPVTTVVTPDDREITVTIDPDTGETIAVDKETGEPTGEPIPEGSVPKPNEGGGGADGGTADGDNAGEETGPGTSMPGDDDDEPGGSSGVPDDDHEPSHSGPGTTEGTTPTTEGTTPSTPPTTGGTLPPPVTPPATLPPATTTPPPPTHPPTTPPPPTHPPTTPPETVPPTTQPPVTTLPPPPKGSVPVSTLPPYWN